MMGGAALQLSIGERAPDIFGSTADGRFYSLDAQAGRPAIIVPLPAARLEAAMKAIEQIRQALPHLDAAGVDVAPIAPVDASLAARLADDAVAREQVIYVPAGGPDYLTPQGDPSAILIDRGGRIVDMLALDGNVDLLGWMRDAASQLSAAVARGRISSAPVLIVPHVAPATFCAALISHFERSAHVPGTMAGFADGAAYHKLDEDKKHRRDLELTSDSPLYAQALDLLASRCAPEIRRVFNVDIATADRVLIARYDDTGGYFKRHRDNAAPHTAFREFAVSLNLNTQDYDGGELLFPEYDDDRYSPPAGSAVIFSAGLLHEAAPVLRGRRYVLLTFLGSAAAQARLNEWLQAGSAGA